MALQYSLPKRRKVSKSGQPPEIELRDRPGAQRGEGSLDALLTRQNGPPFDQAGRRCSGRRVEELKRRAASVCRTFGGQYKCVSPRFGLVQPRCSFLRLRPLLSTQQRKRHRSWAHTTGARWKSLRALSLRRMAASVMLCPTARWTKRQRANGS